MSVTIVADDLTGACDTGTLFAGKAPVPVTVWPDAGCATAVRVIDLETRTLTADLAVARVRRAAQTAPATWYFKKIDSTLRGRIGAETEALMATTGARAALLCPALPGHGRRVVDRLLTIDGIPIAETAIADDPEFPAIPPTTRRESADVIELLRSQVERPLEWIPLADVRGGTAAILDRLERFAGAVILADAETDGDLSALVEAAVSMDAPPLLVGSAGLGRALAARLGLLAACTTVPALPRWLIVAGSRHPTTRVQIEAARGAGLRVIATPDGDLGDRAVAAARLAAAAREVLEAEPVDVVAVTGGETAVALYRALDAERIDLIGCPGPGLAFGYLRSPRWPELRLLTKAGGFGSDDLFVSLAREGRA